MLTPNQIENLPKSMVELYAQVETVIIADMAKRISAYKDFIPAAEWQYIKLTEMGAVHEDIIKKLSKVSGMSSKEIEGLMRDAGVKAIKTDMAVYKKAGLDPNKATEGLQRVLNAGIKNTEGLFSNLTRTTASTASRQFEHALDLSWMQINTGAFSPNEAIANAVRTLTNRGLAVMKYPSGHTDYLDVAVRRAVLTGINQTALRMQDTLADEMQTDLVEVTAHAGARTGKGVANHSLWQGKIYSRSGTSTKYPSLAEATGYGSGEGLGGWNCRHSFSPYIEGASEPVYTQAELDKLNAPMYTFKGNKLTEYEATQYQRKIERNIRRFRREKYAMEAAGVSSDFAKSNLAEWRKEQKIFHEQTGLKRQYDRENVAKIKVDKEQKDGTIKSGAISGALNPDSKEAQEHAEKYYKSVLAMTTDTANISKNTGYKQANIEKVKQHLFIKEHDLGGPKPEMFYPSYDISQSWQRLIDGKEIQPHDYVLLKHEVAEATLMKRGYSQGKAHDRTNKRYNYTKALDER